MPEKRRFSIASLIVTLLVFAGLVGLYYFLVPELVQSQAAVVVGGAAAAALILWLVLAWLAGGSIESAAAAAVQQARSSLPADAPSPVAEPAPVQPEQEPEAEAPKSVPAPIIERDEMPAIQILAILQRKGRLVDFLQEDLSAYADDQIGAAVRTVHEGCKAALDETMTLVPIIEEPEGATFTVAQGFDANRIRLSGSVSGDPPFRGTVQHRGWVVEAIELPTRTKGSGNDMIVAAAEIEV